MENNRLKIHTAARPHGETVQAPAQKKAGRKTHVQRRLLLTAGEKLLCNTAVAAAVFLCVLAIKNVNQPWSNAAVNGIRQAMTMRMDWDESIGRLSFVRALVPDTALVFSSMGEEADLFQPVNGEISHAFSQEQPWLEYAAQPGSQVVATAGGVVTAAAQGMGGDWVVLLDLGGGTEAVYGYLAEAGVKVGQSVSAGDVIGTAAREGAARLYFELRESGEAVDPTTRFR